MCVHLTREDSQRTTTPTNNKKRDYENEGSSMHDGSCIGINYAHRFPKCLRSLHTLLGFSLYSSCRQFNLSLYHFIQFLTCTRIPCRDSHCENGSFEVLSFTKFPVVPQFRIPSLARHAGSPQKLDTKCSEPERWSKLRLRQSSPNQWKETF